jgi:PAS domain S-box-containing protein
MTGNEKVNILMVDDQPAKLLSYEVILADLGENLIKVNSANAALSILLKTDVAVVLMDVSMPDLDGFELADVIRQHPRFQKTAIIFISGVHLTDSDKIQGYRSGAVDYISVPVVPEVLRAKIGVFVELYRKTRQLERMNGLLERLVEERTEALRQSEAEFRMRAHLLELASEAITVRDLDGSVRYWNAGAENMYGWRREEVLGKDLHQLLGTVFPTSRDTIDATLRDGKKWEGNLTQRTKSGREIIVACRKTMDGEDNAILEVSRDVTTQLQAEAALRETERLAAMGRVAGIIAHEINNPLAAITNIFFLVRHHPSLDDEARHYTGLAEAELNRVSHITKQTLSFYRESKQPIPVSVRQLLDDVLELQQREFQTNRIVLQRKYSSDGIIYGYPVELRQIFLNLVGNAIQAMSDGGTLRVNVHDARDWATQRSGVSISIVDTGSGVHPEDAKHLFEPFFTTKAAKGTGLGLWISRGVVHKYDGRIVFRTFRHASLSSTCFQVFLPTTGKFNPASGVAGEGSTREGQSLQPLIP